jgi:ATP-dependent DNA helicase RecQ
MVSPIEIMDKVLNGELDIDIAIGDVENYLQNCYEHSKYLCVLRALENYKYNKFIDFCGHLRQSMVYFKCGFNISLDLYDKLFEYKNMFGFILNNSNGFYVTIDSYILPNIPDLKSLYNFESRRVNSPSVADGRLYRYYDYTHYTSLSQKVLMYMISNMEESETLLACLPTGGGKSLSWELQAISNSYQGLIIVVVPTIALAIDHERTSKISYEKKNMFCNSYPLAYYSGTSPQRKKQIFDEIEAGTLPVLYISPEALQGKVFKNMIYTAAKKGKISALIIDEAHLIINWGIRFRPEFQLLSSFRNSLRELSTNGLKTILLSATFTEEDANMIKIIFDDEIYTEYRADELRPEPTYYLHKCDDENERIDLIKKLICLVPKPIIIYTVTPEQATIYYNHIEGLGYSNIAKFTGKTSNHSREDIIKKWSNNKIDIMIATSAFGMGVDKADVRTIITAYIPETVSRYYQEVGRAGRDGYAALNYWLPCEEIDNDYVSSLTKGVVLTVELIVNRWKALLENSIHEDANKVWVDINSPPEHLRFTTTGKQNLGWNKDVVLLLFRAGLLEIIDVNMISSEDYKILVLLKKISLLENPDRLAKHISRFRDLERERIEDGKAGIRNLLKSPNRKCFSDCFINEFPFAMELCNGCPYCRKLKYETYNNSGLIQIISNKEQIVKKYQITSDDVFTSFLLSSRNIMLSLQEICKDKRLCDCIEFLVKSSVNIIITNNNFDVKSLLQTLSYYDNNKYLIMTLEEAIQINTKWLNGICGAIYSDDEEYNERLYSFTKNLAKENEENKIIHIAKSEQLIKFEGRLLSELVDHNLKGEKYFMGGVAI